MKIKLAQYGISHDHASGKARVMQENDEVDFCGIFEPTADTRNTLGSKPPFADAPWFSSKEEMLEDETIVGIAIQGKVSENLGFAREALEHGKHVWLDKPAGDDLEAFRGVLDIAREKDCWCNLAICSAIMRDFSSSLIGRGRANSETFSPSVDG